MIDAFLYGREIDPRYGVRRVAVGNPNEFGVYSANNYIKNNYSDKSQRIQVYETEPSNSDLVIPVSDNKVTNRDTIEMTSEMRTGNTHNLNSAGHMSVTGTYEGIPVYKD